MKKNVIFIVLDSVTYSNIKGDDTKGCPMPFMESLMKSGWEIEKMYSQAPYTEAALVSLQCGINTLDGTGHMKRNKNHKTMFDIFEKNGYTIFSNAYQPAIYPSGQMKKFENRYYDFPFWFSQFWDYRLKYFKEIYDNDKLTDNEINLLIDMLDDNFIAWQEFFHNLQCKDKSVELLIKSLDLTNLKKDMLLLNAEYKKFQTNGKNYLKELLINGRNHVLFTINDYCPNDKIKNKCTIKYVSKKYKKFIKQVFYTNIKYNLRNNRLSYIVIKNFLKNHEYNKIIRYFMNYLNAVFDKDLLKRTCKKYDAIKTVPSLNKMIEHFLTWEKTYKQEKPYFAYIHAEDNHFPETFFSYDSENISLIDQEFKILQDYFITINKKYKGAISYDFSLRYSDFCIEKMINELNNSGKLENTTIVITADHGFSYYYNPIRENFVINYYNETYNIPFILYDKSIKSYKNYNKFLMTKDILPTILEISGNKPIQSIKSKSFVNFDGRDYAMIEYMGGGCPHYYRKNVQIGIRNEKHSVVLSIPLKGFDKYKLLSCYDLLKDPGEKNNLIYSNIDINKIEQEIKMIKKRYEEIKKEINNSSMYY